VFLESWGIEETNSVVVLIEIRVVLCHESVSEDEIVETFREILSHNSQNTLGVWALCYFQDVVFRSKIIINVINLEGNGRELFDTWAIFVNGDTLDKGLNESVGSDEDWGTWINNSSESIRGNLDTSLFNSSQVKGVVLLFNDIVELEFLSINGFLIKTWEGHVRGFWVFVEIEWETLVGKVAGVNEGWELVNWDATVGET